jgi:hexosaminidase
MHLDVSRHFFSIDYLKKFIDLLALYKFNKLHLHLTDDQGWRIEIRKYPKLTEEGAWRTFNNQDSACMLKSKNNPDFVIDPKHIIRKDGKTLYGGFYTQKEMKGVVAYALARHIDIIPEIDMPGHMMAAINSYPFLTSNGENKWGKLFTTPVCPCKETTFEFAQNVFTEIMEIFPGKYIHIGGDEVDRTSWEQAESCKELMVKNNIRTTAELQSYFINRMEKFFNSKGRKLIGWDEILEDGISSTAVVMYWRSWVPDAPVKAARNGNQVVMSPGNPLYFDNDPDRNSLYEVYHFNPVPAKLAAAEAKGVIGAQANTWSEKIPSENRADYMIFPRMTALAEVLWTNKNRYESYLKRLKAQFSRLDALHVSYRLPDVPGLVEQNVFTDETVLNPVKPLPDLSFHYTTDGSLPQLSSAPLNTAVKISKNTFIRLAAFTAGGRRGDVYDLHYTQQDFAQSVNTLLAKPGLTCNYYPGAFKNSRSVTDEAKAAFKVDSVVVPKQADAPAFILKYKGYLDIPEDGIYNFFLNCDDGGILNIAGREVIDNDGPHGPFEKSGQVALRKGMQPIALDFIEGGGGYTLKLKYSLNGSQPKEIPPEWLKH